MAAPFSFIKGLNIPIHTFTSTTAERAPVSRASSGDGLPWRQLTVETYFGRVPSMSSQSNTSTGVPSPNGTAFPDPEISAQASQMDTDHGDSAVELEQMQLQDGEPKLPLHEDIMQLAMLGEIRPIEKLVDEGRYSSRYKDREGITPLHVRSLLLISSQANAGLYSGQQSTITTHYANT